MDGQYSAPEYWDQIYGGAWDESAVGYPNLARSINRARYDVERRNVERALALAGVPPPERVLDVGSGTGIWIEFWKRRGAREIIGVDITETAVGQLRRRFPEHEFLRSDIGEADATLPGAMDIVSAMSVLLHITDDTRFEQAVKNLLGCLRPGGTLVLTEPVIVHSWWGGPTRAAANSRARPLATYTDLLGREGFAIAALRPATSLLGNVIDARSGITFRLLERYWELLGRGVGRRERLGRLVGAVLRPLDLALTRVLPSGPSAKVIVARPRVAVEPPSRRKSGRLRILMLPEWYPSRSDPVAGTFVRDQARALAREHDVTVLVPDAGAQCPRGSSETAVEDCVRTIRIRTHARPGSTGGRLELVLAAMRILRDMRLRGEGPDVLHAHVYSSGLLALLAARGRYPVVLSEHNSDFIEGKVVGRSAVVAHYVLKRAAVVCPVSAALKDHLELFEPSGRYEVVPNVVDVGAFTQIAQRRSGRASDGVTRLLAVATLSRQKGLGYLVEALEMVHRIRQDFTLDLVGDGQERNKLEALAAARLPSGVISFHGWRSRAEVVELMELADVFILPSIVETFGVALIEALAAGLPIITTTAVPEHERLDRRFGIVVSPRDPAGLRDAILTMLGGGWEHPIAAAAQLARAYGDAEISRRWNDIYSRAAQIG
jgi:glycosyltransferase involved in cell wall biosynthesis/SAM-dependent methyltransferase